jgi:hypothetical protein
LGSQRELLEHGENEEGEMTRSAWVGTSAAMAVAAAITP